MGRNQQLAIFKPAHRLILSDLTQGRSQAGFRRKWQPSWYGFTVKPDTASVSISSYPRLNVPCAFNAWSWQSGHHTKDHVSFAGALFYPPHHLSSKVPFRYFYFSHVPLSPADRLHSLSLFDQLHKALFIKLYQSLNYRQNEVHRCHCHHPLFGCLCFCSTNLWASCWWYELLLILTWISWEANRVHIDIAERQNHGMCVTSDGTTITKIPNC